MASDWTTWRCADHPTKFCPEEGCPAKLGCARAKGWSDGEPTPPAYQGIVEKPDGE